MCRECPNSNCAFALMFTQSSEHFKIWIPGLLKPSPLWFISWLPQGLCSSMSAFLCCCGEEIEVETFNESGWQKAVDNKATDGHFAMVAQTKSKCKWNKCKEMKCSVSSPRHLTPLNVPSQPLSSMFLCRLLQCWILLLFLWGRWCETRCSRKSAPHQAKLYFGPFEDMILSICNPVILKVFPHPITLAAADNSRTESKQSFTYPANT